MDYSAIHEFARKAGEAARKQSEEDFIKSLGLSCPVSLEYVYSPTSDSHSGCDHEFVDVGFQFTKLVCKKCNKEMP